MENQKDNSSTVFFLLLAAALVGSAVCVSVFQYNEKKNQENKWSDFHRAARESTERAIHRQYPDAP